MHLYLRRRRRFYSPSVWWRSFSFSFAIDAFDRKIGENFYALNATIFHNLFRFLPFCFSGFHFASSMNVYICADCVGILATEHSSSYLFAAKFRFARIGFLSLRPFPIPHVSCVSFVSIEVPFIANCDELRQCLWGTWSTNSVIVSFRFPVDLIESNPHFNSYRKCIFSTK